MKKIIHGEGSPSLQTEYGYLTRVVHSLEQKPDPKKEVLVKEIIIEKLVDRPIEVIKNVIVEVEKVVEKIIEVPKEIIVEKIVERIVEIEKEVEKKVIVEKPVVQVIEIEKPVEIEKIVFKPKMPSWAKILLFGETLLIILGVIKCLE